MPQDSVSPISVLSTYVKLSDIIGGTGAMLIALLYIAPHSPWAGTRSLLTAAAIAGLGSGWYVARERHWIMKIFLYAGMMVLCIFIVGFILQTTLKLVG